MNVEGAVLKQGGRRPRSAMLTFVLGLFVSGVASQVAMAVEPATTQMSHELQGNKLEADPEDLIRRFISSVEAARTLESETVYRARLEYLVPVVTGLFDMSAMSAAIVGRSVWRRWSAQEQVDFSNVMAELLAATIAGRLDVETNSPTSLIETVPGPAGSKIVRTLAIQNEEPIRVDYRVAVRDGHWAIVDIVADAKVSEVARRRAEFLAIIQTEGHAGIVAAIEKKILQLDRSGA